jgi:hypothetical protein
LSDFNAISYVGRLWCPGLIPDIEKFLPVAIFKMATTILHKFNIVRFHILKMATGRNFSMLGINSGHHYLPTYTILIISDNVEFLPPIFYTDSAQIQHCSISTSWIDSRHWKISTGLHVQNGRHNTAQIQHCPISTTFHMWVDYDVRIYSRHWTISSGRHFQNGRKIKHCPISLRFDMGR